VSEAVRQQMAEYYGLPLGRIVTVRNGVDLGEFYRESAASTKSSTGLLVIGAAGRLEAMKGFEYLIAAVRELQELGIEFELRIAGIGSRQRDLEREVKSLGLDRKARFLGQVSDMAAFYRSVDVFALPSVSTEGLPLVVLEAMAMGLPVVATRLAGAPEVIEDGVNGLLVPPGDAPALARALSLLAADGELRRRLAMAGKSDVRHRFSVERVATEVTRVYRTVLCDGSTKVEAVTESRAKHV
jgi:glycosyltransferase involved in cell wall biosynthesis